MNELIAVATITILAVISPGPDFAMVTRNSYAFGSRTGLLSALGIACGVQVHVMYTVFGIAVLIAGSPLLFMTMKVLGTSYLIYLGYKSLTNKTVLTLEEAAGSVPSPFAAFRMGFLTNALNPKTMLFVVATYSQVVQPGSPLSHNFAYGLFMSAAHWVWFSIVALFFAAPTMRRRLLKQQSVVDKSIGIVLIVLGASLAFTKVVI
ncbi:LysE family translocator [Prodigiosinella confusarubida]|uniref:LysE family translocator n=1 Tax=Serratia sp. (strain ATCC 39006) TaxID=104623 RepID=A0A2I5T5Z5_SERS3|nr:LysE family translocator [Serratia sp. ATCC 39006]AUG99992.1 LysE family translocator [Serratia sp. ATCC 39006]AUH04312.1 LysE family translocator [Serratia sp. ATCC 39006]